MAGSDLVSAADLTAFRDADEETLVGQVQAAIRSRCGWHIAPNILDIRRLDGHGSQHLWLPSLHVTDILSVTNAGVSLDVENDIDWSEDGYVELRRGTWTNRPRQVEITFNHGYVQPPADLVGVAVGIADRSGPTGGTTSESTGQVRLTFGTFNGVSGGIALLAHEKEIIDHYKLPSRA